mmetsp:Transcript_9858/g.15150  ORF Transcript_9858/g.15150 Transcript_9858/m.15150 type:complete len:83 (+) Transcript_9858:149-397(+)
MTISSFSLKGHKSSVNCLECSKNNDSSLLLSGSDDKTARLWDVRTSKTVLCMQTASPVLSVAFRELSAKVELAGSFSKKASV